MCRKYGRITHPIWWMGHKRIYHRDSFVSEEVRALLATQSTMTVHHLVPKARHINGSHLPQDRKCVLKIWAHKHFLGWNPLFQFSYPDSPATKQHTELTIDEIITCMEHNHAHIASKVGTVPWQLVFKNMTLQEAAALLRRVVRMKLKRDYIPMSCIHLRHLVPHKHRIAA